MDVKKGYGEMYWSDGTIYRGFWDNGLQHGVGLMIFKDGVRKAGFFEKNIYVSALGAMNEFNTFLREIKKKVPETFR